MHNVGNFLLLVTSISIFSAMELLVYTRNYLHCIQFSDIPSWPLCTSPIAGKNTTEDTIILKVHVTLLYVTILYQEETTMSVHSIFGIITRLKDLGNVVRSAFSIHGNP